MQLGMKPKEVNNLYTTPQWLNLTVTADGNLHKYIFNPLGILALWCNSLPCIFELRVYSHSTLYRVAS